MRIYLAASYSQRARLQGYAAELSEMGHTVTSRWLSSAHDNMDDHTEDHALQGQWSEDDFEDIWSADLLIVFTMPQYRERSRGGMHVEVGMALAFGCQVIEVGDNYPNVFYCMPRMEHCKTWEQCVAKLPRLSPHLVYVELPKELTR